MKVRENENMSQIRLRRGKGWVTLKPEEKRNERAE